MFIHLVLILGLFLLAVAVTMVLRALTAPRGPSTETIEQIGHYGFAGSLPAAGGDEDHLDVVLAQSLGGLEPAEARAHDEHARPRLVAHEECIRLDSRGA